MSKNSPKIDRKHEKYNVVDDPTNKVFDRGGFTVKINTSIQIPVGFQHE